MKYRIKVANLSQGVDLEGVQDDIDELHRTYLESEPFLGKLTEGKKERIQKSVIYVKSIIGVIQEYKSDYKKRQGEGQGNESSGIKLKIA